MTLQTILVPVDFSACSLGVVRHAATLAQKLGATIHIVHIAELPPGVSPQTKVGAPGHQQSAGDLLEADAQHRLAPFVEIAAEYAVKADITEAYGPVAPTILALAKSMQTDMIIMGTHGRAGLARLVLGSVAEAVVHGADVPVTLIRRQPRPECGKDDCSWCAVGGRSPTEALLDAERNG